MSPDLKLQNEFSLNNKISSACILIQHYNINSWHYKKSIIFKFKRKLQVNKIYSKTNLTIYLILIRLPNFLLKTKYNLKMIKLNKIEVHN